MVPFARTRQRFYSKTRPGPCLEWTASKNHSGYGWFSLEGRAWLAHRVAWILERGPIPDGLCVLHTCDNPSCVAIDHLWLGTQADNNRDMDAKGRRYIPPKGGPMPAGRPLWGEENGQAKLTNAVVHRLRIDYAHIKRGPGGHPRWGEVRKLVEKYGISQSALRRAVRGKTWAHLTDSGPRHDRS